MTKEKWEKTSFYMQMANMGAEVERTIVWKGKDDDKSKVAFNRGLELLDLTIEDKKNHKGKLKELSRLREVLVDYFMGDNIYKSNHDQWNNYFYPFSCAAAVERENRYNAKT